MNKRTHKHKWQIVFTVNNFGYTKTQEVSSVLAVCTLCLEKRYVNE